MQLKTAKGKIFQIDWIGVSTIDGFLRFCVVDESLSNAFSAFTSREETILLTSELDGLTRDYKGYTVFKSLDQNADGSIVVALGKD